MTNTDKMEKMECYLDNAATTRVLDEAADTVRQVMLQDFGNPSSLHGRGIAAEKYITDAKNVFAGILKCSPERILFTSGGTESNNTALIGTAIAKKNRGRHIITTQIEHPAVARPAGFLAEQGFEIDFLSVDPFGRIDLEELESLIREDTILVSVMHINNEIGTIEPVSEAGKLIHDKNPACLFHVDDIQGFCKQPLLPEKSYIDLLSVSSHKIHGPKGNGLLYISGRTHISPLIFGGGQMGGMRSGTENVPGIAGFAKAAEILNTGLPDKISKMRELRGYFVKELLKIPEVFINGPEDNELAAPHIVSASVKGIRSAVLLNALSDRGIYVSSGSACSSNHKAVSATLKAIGAPDWAHESTVRFSFSCYTEQEELDYTLAALNELIPQLRKFIRR